MPDSFDLIVIGTGVGASTVIKKCRAAGWSVAVIDRRPYGGTCVLRGCDPKRVLVGAAEAVDAARRLRGKGVAFEDLGIWWRDLMHFKRSFTDPVSRQREESYGTAGIFTYHGVARFTGHNTVRVGNSELQGRRVHIAAGARPMDLRIPGQEHLTTSDEFLELTSLPRRVLFIGGGFISFELAHVAARAGADVKILHMDDAPLPQFDPDLVSMLVQHTRDMGVDIRTETTARAIERGKQGLVVTATGPDGEEARFAADLVVHGAGRVPALDDLELERAGIERTRDGVVVNEYMQSISNAAVYAAGDAVAVGPPLTPVAALQARVATANLLEGNHTQIEYPPIASVVFTVPPLASVGLSEREAREQGLDLEVHFERTSGWYSSRRVNQACSGFKLLIDKRSHHVVGAHLVGPYADEQINLFALAMSAGLTTRDITRAVFAYPTSASDLSSML